MSTKTWNLIGLDVWGNDKDGYEVNDRFTVLSDIKELPDEPTNDDFACWLRANGFLHKQVNTRYLSFEWIGENNIMVYREKDLIPLYEFERK